MIPGPIEAWRLGIDLTVEARYIRGVIPGPIEAIRPPARATAPSGYIRGVIPGPIEASAMHLMPASVIVTSGE